MTTEQRLDHLEQQLGRYKRFTALLAVFVCVLVTSGAMQDGKPRDVVFKKITCDSILIDTMGKSKNAIDALANKEGRIELNTYGLKIWDPHSKRSLSLTRPAGLSIMEEQKNGSWSTASVMPGGLSVSSSGSKVNVESNRLSIENRSSYVRDANNRPVKQQNFAIQLSSLNGSGRVQVNGPKNSPGVTIQGRESAGLGGFLQVTNKDKEPVIQLSIDKNGNGLVGAFDRKGNGRVLKPGP